MIADFKSTFSNFGITCNYITNVYSSFMNKVSIIPYILCSPKVVFLIMKP